MVRVSTPRQSGGPVIGGRGRGSGVGGGPENLTAQVHVVSSLDASNCDPSEVAPLSRCAFFSYAVGHVLNDMCASCWFTYLLVYLQKTPDIALHSGEAAGVLLAGQVADAIATPLVGVFSDRSKGCAALGFGRRKFWFFTGTLMAAACFFLVFGQCLPCSITDGAVGQTYLLLYYCAAASFFNVGWAAVQVSHMSMVPELTPLDAERVALNSARYAFTVLSNVAVFVIFFILIQLNGGSKDGPTYVCLFCCCWWEFLRLRICQFMHLFTSCYAWRPPSVWRAATRLCTGASFTCSAT